MLARWTYEGCPMTKGAASHPTAPKPGALGTARRLDLAALEERRIRAARLLREGVWPAEVARRVGVHRQSVSRWARKLKRGGERALGAGRVGRPARLHGEDLRRVEGQLKRGPGTLGYKKWTSARVKELIEPAQLGRFPRRGSKFNSKGVLIPRRDAACRVSARTQPSVSLALPQSRLSRILGLWTCASIIQTYRLR
jgi:transposase